MCQLISDSRKCSNKFVKATAPCFLLGKWFCSEACVDDDKEIKEMQRIQQEKEKHSQKADKPAEADESSDDVEVEL